MYSPHYAVEKNLKCQALDTAPHAPGNVAGGRIEHGAGQILIRWFDFETKETHNLYPLSIDRSHYA